MESMKRREANSSHHHQSKVAFNSPPSSSSTATAITTDEQLQPSTHKKQSAPTAITPSTTINKGVGNNSRGPPASTSSRSTNKGIEQKSTIGTVLPSSATTPTTPSTTSADKDANFEYDDNEWDVRGIGDLIIDLDADIEKSSLNNTVNEVSSQEVLIDQQRRDQIVVTEDKKGSPSNSNINALSKQQPPKGDHHTSASSVNQLKHINRGTPLVATTTKPIASLASGGGGGQGIATNIDDRVVLSHQLKNSTKQVTFESSDNNNRVVKSSGFGTVLPESAVSIAKDLHQKAMSSASAGSGAGKASSTKMAMDHQATLDKGLKMKIKRTKPGTKTSEAKHEIVKSEQNGLALQDDSVTVSPGLNNNKKYCAGTALLGSAVANLNTATPTSNQMGTMIGQQANAANVSGLTGSSSATNNNNNASTVVGNALSGTTPLSSHVNNIAATGHMIQQVGAIGAGSGVMNNAQSTTGGAQTVTNKRNSSGHRRDKGVKDKLTTTSSQQQRDKPTIETGSSGISSVNTINNSLAIKNQTIGCSCTVPDSGGQQQNGGANSQPCSNGQCPLRGLSTNKSNTSNSSNPPNSGSDLASKFVKGAGETTGASALSVASSSSSSATVTASATSAEVEGRNDSPPIKKLKGETQLSRDMHDACVGTSVGTITEPDCLGPCEPGTSVTLEGIVWHETEGGVLVVNVTWRGKTYVGTLLDCTRHDWAPPRFCDSPIEDLDSRAPKGRGKRGRGAAQTPNNDLLNYTETRSSVHSKLRNGGGKGGRGGRMSSTAAIGASGNSAAAMTTTTSTGHTSSSGAAAAAAGLVTISPSPNVLSNIANMNANVSAINNNNKQEKRKMSTDETNSNSNDGQQNATSAVLMAGQSGPAPMTPAPGTSVVNPVTGLNVQILPKKVKTTSPCAISPVLLECPEQFCSKKYNNANGLRYHQSFAHGGGSATTPSNAVNSGQTFSSLDEDSLIQQPDSPGIVPCQEPPPSSTTVGYASNNSRSSPLLMSAAETVSETGVTTIDKKPESQLELDSSNVSLNLSTTGCSSATSGVLRFGQSSEEMDDSMEGDSKLEGTSNKQQLQHKKPSQVHRKSPFMEGPVVGGIGSIPVASGIMQHNRAEEVKSPAYSDISDDSTPVTESDSNPKAPKSGDTGNGSQSSSSSAPPTSSSSTAIKGHAAQSAVPVDYGTGSVAPGPVQMSAPGANYGVFPFYAQSQFMGVDQLTGKPLTPMNPGPVPSQQSIIGTPPNSLCDYKAKESPALDLMTKGNHPSTSGGAGGDMSAVSATSTLEDFHASNAAAVAAANVIARQQAKAALAHFYPPYNYHIPPNYQYNLDPSFVAMLSEENKMKEEAAAAAAAAAAASASSNHKGKERASPVDINNKMPKLIKNEPGQQQHQSTLKDMKLESHSKDMVSQQQPPHSPYGGGSSYARHGGGGGPLPSHLSREEELRRYHNSMYPEQRRHMSGIKEEPQQLVSSPQQQQQQQMSYSMAMQSNLPNQQPPPPLPLMQTQTPPSKGKSSQSLQQSLSSKQQIKTESSAKGGSIGGGESTEKESKGSSSSNKSNVSLPPPQQEGQKPTMETQGPPPPPTSQYYLHPSSYMQPPFGFDPSHPMYRNILVPTPSPYNHSSYHHHAMQMAAAARYHGPEDLSRSSVNPGGGGGGGGGGGLGGIGGGGPKSSMDLMQQHHHYYNNSHKIHELTERAHKSPPTGTGGQSSGSGAATQSSGSVQQSSSTQSAIGGPNNSGTIIGGVSGNNNNKMSIASSPSNISGSNVSGGPPPPPSSGPGTVSGGLSLSGGGVGGIGGGVGVSPKTEPMAPNIGGSGGPANQSSSSATGPPAPAGAAGKDNSGSSNSNSGGRSPPPQRHVHTHHHTHVGLASYAMYTPAPYGAAAASVAVNPYSPTTGPTK